MDIKKMAEEVHQTAVSKGWHEQYWSIPELLCLIHSEVSEALVAYRIAEREQLSEELADIVIRVFDMSESLKINIEKEIIKKNDFNKTRPHKHGGKLI